MKFLLTKGVVYLQEITQMMTGTRTEVGLILRLGVAVVAALEVRVILPQQLQLELRALPPQIHEVVAIPLAVVVAIYDHPTNPSTHQELRHQPLRHHLDPFLRDLVTLLPLLPTHTPQRATVLHQVHQLHPHPTPHHIPVALHHRHHRLRTQQDLLPLPSPLLAGTSVF